MSVNTKLTALADEIRELSGTTTAKSLDTMTSDVNAANDLIDEQESLLNDLRDIVDTLPEPGIDTSDATANTQTIASGYTAYVKGSKVTGSVPQRTSNDVTASGATVNIPAGFYMGTVSKTITTGKATTPTTTITATPTISIDSAGKITASTSASKSITPTITAGYISSGTAGTVTASGSNTKQLTTKAATTYTPGTSNQTIAASTYLTGAQTIKGDSNLVASNIKNGISIFGTVGTLEPATDGVVYHSDENGNDGLSIDRSFSYIDVKQENEIYTYADCYIMPSGNLWFNEADGTTDLYINTIFDNIVISEDNRVEIQNRNCDLNFNGETYVVINADDGMRTDLEINSSFNHIEFNAGNRITVYDSELIIASDESGSLELEDFSGQVSARTLIPENIKSGVNVLGVIGNYSGSAKSYGSHLIEAADGYYEYNIPDSAHFIIDCSEYYMGDLSGVAIRINGSTKLCFGDGRGSSGMNIGLDDYECVHVLIKGSYVTFVSEGGSCYIHDEQALIQGFEIATIANASSVSIYVTHEI